MSSPIPGHTYGENEQTEAEMLDMEICDLCMGSGETADHEGQSTECACVKEERKQRNGEAQGDQEREEK